MFKPNVNFLTAKLLKLEYLKYINQTNLHIVSRRQALLILNRENKVEIEKYLKLVLSMWVEEKNNQNRLFIKNFKKILKRHRLVFNEIEKYDTLILMERFFSIERPLKVLGVSVKELKRENFYIKYENASLFSYKKSIRGILHGTLLISNQRIIFKSEFDLEILAEFYWKKVLKYFYTDEGLVINYGDSLFLIKIHDSVVLKNVVENFFEKQGKIWN